MRVFSKPLALGSLLLLAACEGGGDDDGNELVDAAQGNVLNAQDGGAEAGRADAMVSGPLDGTTPMDASGMTSDASTPADASAGDASKEAGSATSGETGRLIGITEAHNKIRAGVMTTTAIPPLAWSQALADYAQQWADSLASNPTTCHQPQHRTREMLQAVGYGENLATLAGAPTVTSTASQIVNMWASEVACYTFGTIGGTEKCDVTCYKNLSSDGCGHYTQVVWRKTTLVGCGVATCQDGIYKRDIWICNYKAPGNYQGQTPY